MARLHFQKFERREKLTHYLFRFPAKFHPPAVRCLIARYSKPGNTILDPFCGSGTSLLEAIVSERHAIGVDIDPLAAFISRVKCTPVGEQVLIDAFDRLRREIVTIRRPEWEYAHLVHEDLSPVALRRLSSRFKIPSIPNITHWFRTYVAIDLARLRLAIIRSNHDKKTRDFFLACFASVIRNASNADPVPVSGLEVTAHMKQIDKLGRRIDPFELFERRVQRELVGMRQLVKQATGATVRVRRGDATQLQRYFAPETVDVVVTSPPYNNAVDYYRRHMLEMYWLGFVSSHEERLALAPQYIGRNLVRRSNRRLKRTFASAYVTRLLVHASRISAARHRAVAHYCASMELALTRLSVVLKRRGLAILVVGNAKWNGKRVRATKLLRELATPTFDVIDVLSYRAHNRYMSYQRHNGADVDREYALVLEKK